MTYRFAKRKLWFENLAMWPFVLLGRLAGYCWPLKEKHGAILFFPNGDIGGSPQVNIDLLHCIRHSHPLVIFSKKPGNNQFRDKYTIEGVKVIDWHRYIDNKLFHFVNFFFRGVAATWINKQPHTVVFGGECIYFYKVIPHLRKDIRCVELCHLATWLPYSIGFIDRVNLRVFSTEYLRKQVEEQYRLNRLPAPYFERLFFIDNAIDIPALPDTNNDRLQVYFIGRGAPQKRAHLVAATAKIIHEKGLPVDFIFVGDVENVIDTAAYPYCRFRGNIGSQTEMQQLYREADVLLMTSSFEGLPIVVMQMMAHGKLVISTAVNGIPDYIHHNENGLLIYSQTEPEIVQEAAGLIERVLSDPALRKKLGRRSREIAIEKFSREAFCKGYHQLLGL
ncbi:MAG: glycosyltransferase family 4 protein [Ferruginibacter sp.]